MFPLNALHVYEYCIVHVYAEQATCGIQNVTEVNYIYFNQSSLWY